MQPSYTVRQDADESWSVLNEATGEPLRLAGIPQTRLTLLEAEVTMELLEARMPRPHHTPRPLPRTGVAALVGTGG